MGNSGDPNRLIAPISLFLGNFLEGMLGISSGIALTDAGIYHVARKR
jgi:hypothetical protein